MADFTHFNENGRAKMVDVSEKADTVRTAVAAGRVIVNAGTFELIRSGGMKKGDVLCTLYSDRQDSLDPAAEHYLSAIRITKEKPQQNPLVYTTVK